MDASQNAAENRTANTTTTATIHSSETFLTPQHVRQCPRQAREFLLLDCEYHRLWGKQRSASRGSGTFCATCPWHPFQLPLYPAIWIQRRGMQRVQEFGADRSLVNCASKTKS